MFGFRSAVPSRAHRSLVEAENALMAQATRHPDGWGIGWFVDDDAYVVKSSEAAHICERFRQFSDRLTSSTFVVHVRRATVGQVDHLNAHPFRFGRYLFAHNGTVFGLGDEGRGQHAGLGAWLADRTDPALRAQILGETDSERVFFYLLSALKGAGLDPTGRVSADSGLVGDIVRRALMALDVEAVSEGLPRPLLNVILTDGGLLVAHRSGLPLHLSTQKQSCPESLTCKAIKVCLEAVRRPDHPVNHLLVASEPIGMGDNRWEELEDGSTVVLDPGFRLVIHGPPPDWQAPHNPYAHAMAA